MKKMVIKIQSKETMNVDSRPDFHATDIDGNDTNYNGNYEFFSLTTRINKCMSMSHKRG